MHKEPIIFSFSLFCSVFLFVVVVVVVVGEQAKLARHSQVCSIENRYICVYSALFSRCLSRFSRISTIVNARSHRFNNEASHCDMPGPCALMLF